MTQQWTPIAPDARSDGRVQVLAAAEELRRKATNSSLIGVLAMVFSVLVAIVSISTASSHGGYYFVAIGPIVYGFNRLSHAGDLRHRASFLAHAATVGPAANDAGADLDAPPLTLASLDREYGRVQMDAMKNEKTGFSRPIMITAFVAVGLLALLFVAIGIFG